MIRVLVVEDDTAKLQRIAAVLAEAGIAIADIADARSVNQAKLWLRRQSCDLMILDLNLPRQLDEAPERDAGVVLLQEIASRDKYHKPRHVIGLSEYADAVESAAPVFEAALVYVVKYDRADDTWRGRLKSKVEYIVAATVPAQPAGEVDFGCFAAIVTALERPELRAVLDIPWHWEPLPAADDDTSYFSGTLDGGQPRKIIAAASPFMGMPCATATAMKVIDRFRPRYLIHCGITAGVRGRVELGDVLVADPSWDWGSGKFSVESGTPIFVAAPYQIMMREDVRGKIRRLAADEALLASIKAAWPGPRPPASLSVRIGPVASGASVLADGVTAKGITLQHRKLLGIEMETYGVMAAAEFCTRPRPMAMSLKSVCDFADQEKADAMQPYAAYTSARAVQALLERFLI